MSKQRRTREYGLVFEHNRPEAMRLYGKPIKPGDTVNVLPERGKKESDENRVEWRVLDLDDGTVSLAQVNDAETMCEASVDDVVAVAGYDQPIYAGLRETGRVERGGGTLGDPGDKPYHMVINGENYHALQALGFCYAGKVDCIYIDPPYNTGAKDWKYNNDY
ncbi:MAG: site-specific DNA-methyltransferase, partial [Aeriscardovia sp.]|nr:site-specific DNA-methyltransferase [Aeriscardovia sp.]